MKLLTERCNNLSVSLTNKNVYFSTNALKKAFNHRI